MLQNDCGPLLAGTAGGGGLGAASLSASALAAPSDGLKTYPLAGADLAFLSRCSITSAGFTVDPFGQGGGLCAGLTHLHPTPAHLNGGGQSHYGGSGAFSR